MTPPSAPRQVPPRQHSSPWPALATGLALVSAAAVAALYFAQRPAATGLDQWATSATASLRHSSLLKAVTKLGSPAGLLVGVTVLAFATGRDVRRVVACSAGPLLAAGIAELALKPGVGRTYQGVLTFPSGTVVVVAALAAAITVAAPGALRVVAGGVAGAVTVLAVVAVVALRWHYFTDALAGAALGIGIVVGLAGATALVQRHFRRR